MAFIQMESWEVLDRRASVDIRSGGSATWFEKIFAAAGPKRRKGTAWLLTVLVHCVLAWILLHRMGADAPSRDLNGAIGVLNLLSPIAEASTAPETVQSPQANPNPESIVDASIPTELPKPEWSISRIRMVRPAEAPAAPPSKTGNPNASSGPAGGSAAGGGGWGYDPYAGAAPLRRDEAGLSKLAEPSLGDRILGALGLKEQSERLPAERDVIKAIRLQVLRKIPGARGTVELSLLISRTGSVLEATIEGGTASAHVKDVARFSAVGRSILILDELAAQTVTSKELIIIF